MLIFTRYPLMVLNSSEGIHSLGLRGLIQPVLGAASCDHHPPRAYPGPAVCQSHPAPSAPSAPSTPPGCSALPSPAAPAAEPPFRNPAMPFYTLHK